MKQARFFCENCGAEAARDAKQCQKCGKFFSSILCPSCGFSGEEFLFDRGCPVCGYSTPEKPGSAKPSRSRTGEAAGALPWWVYALTLCAFLAVAAAFFFLR
jgi:predicted RNA-binding Zn-ribbon protein involved in translation (DUF1610 family)